MNTDILKQVCNLCTEYDMLPKQGTVLCAVSGGADSMALLHLLTGLQEQFEFTLHAAHFNHQLRGEESLRDAAFVADYCKKNGIPFSLGEGNVKEEAARLGRGIEVTARNMRYAFLEDTAKEVGALRIATAHHADDNIETFLLRMIRGTGLRGLSGIPPMRGIIVRPMLYVSRQDIHHYIEANQLDYMVDSSNLDKTFIRNRLRHDVVPVLRELNPNLSQSLTATVRSLREDQVFIDARALELFRQAHRAEDGMVIPTEILATAPKALAVRVVQKMLEEIEAPVPGQVHFNAVIALAQGSDPSSSLHLPGGILVHRAYGDMLIAWDHEHEPLSPMETVSLNLDGVTECAQGTWRVTCRRVTCPERASQEKNAFYVAAALTQGKLVLRARETGDTIARPGRRHKPLKKLFIEEKVPRRIRERLPILADEEGVIAVAGLGPDRRRLAQTGEEAFYISFAAIEKKEGEDTEA